MLHKLGYDYICERCGKPASDDDSSACDYENNLCTDCVNADIVQMFRELRGTFARVVPELRGLCQEPTFAQLKAEKNARDAEQRMRNEAEQEHALRQAIIDAFALDADTIANIVKDELRRTR